MNKTELIDAVADAAGLGKADAQRAVEALFDPTGGIISGTLRRDDKVQITGFGTFESRERKARKGRNPRTGEEIDIAASKSVAFRAGKGLKDAVK